MRVITNRGRVRQQFSGSAPAQRVYVNTSGVPLAREQTNFIAGANITLTSADSDANDEQQITIAAAGSSLSNPVTVPQGGTGDITLANHGLLVGRGTIAVATITPGTSGLALVSQGVPSDPAYIAIDGTAFATQSANQVFSGPTSGAAAAPTFRALAGADLPTDAKSTDKAFFARLTLVSNLAVPTTDQTAKTTVYLLPYISDRLDIYDGSANWKRYNLATAGISVAVPANTNLPFDVFVYDNAGTLTLDAVAWTSASLRSTALTTQDGVYVKSGATARRYCGTCCTTGTSGQTEDSAANRLVWNYYNRVNRQIQKLANAANWAYSSATIRQANGSTTHQVTCVIGVQEDAIDLSLLVIASSTNGQTVKSGIGEDSTTTFSAFCTGGPAVVAAANEYASMNCRFVKQLVIGLHTYSWNEQAPAALGTTTWYGTDENSGIVGVIRA